MGMCMTFYAFVPEPQGPIDLVHPMHKFWIVIVQGTENVSGLPEVLSPGRGWKMELHRLAWGGVPCVPHCRAAQHVCGPHTCTARNATGCATSLSFHRFRHAITLDARLECLTAP